MNTAHQTPRVEAGSLSGDLWLRVVFAHDADDAPDADELRVPVDATLYRDECGRLRADDAAIDWERVRVVNDDGPDAAQWRKHAVTVVAALRAEPWWPSDDVLLETWEACGGPGELRAWRRECAAE